MSSMQSLLILKNTQISASSSILSDKASLSKLSMQIRHWYSLGYSKEKCVSTARIAECFRVAWRTC